MRRRSSLVVVSLLLAAGCSASNAVSTEQRCADRGCGGLTTTTPATTTTGSTVAASSGPSEPAATSALPSEAPTARLGAVRGSGGRGPGHRVRHAGGAARSRRPGRADDRHRRRRASTLPTTTIRSARSCSTPAGPGASGIEYLVSAAILDPRGGAGAVRPRRLRPAWRGCERGGGVRLPDRRQRHPPRRWRRSRMGRTGRRRRGVPRHVRPGVAGAVPVGRHQQRGSRPRSAARGAGRRAADLRRLLVRHPTRVDLCRVVPRPGARRSCSTVR